MVSRVSSIIFFAAAGLLYLGFSVTGLALVAGVAGVVAAIALATGN